MEINKEILENNIEGFSLETPLREDAFKLDDELKIELISKHFKEIMQILQVLKLIMIDNENNLIFEFISILIYIFILPIKV